MLKKLFCPVIIGLVLGASAVNAQYGEKWHTEEYFYPSYMGCENTDDDAAKEVVYSFYNEVNGEHHIEVIDGITGDQEWISEVWDNLATIYLIDVDGDGRYEILFKGRKLEGDPWIYYLYEYTGSGLEESSQKIYKPKVFQNYPNPMSSVTTIRYHLPEKGRVTLKIYNGVGQLVRTLVEGEKEPGEYATLWDARNNRGKKVASGSYFYQLETGNFSSSKKLILVK